MKVQVPGDMNESNEAYERRMEILSEATYILTQPQGTRFQWRWRSGDEWFDCEENWEKWDFLSRAFRIAPTPKKVLRPWHEIYQIENKRADYNFMSLGLIALAKDQIDKMAGKTYEEIPGSETFPDEWFTEASK